MIDTLFTRYGGVPGREVREPTLLAIALTILGFLLLLAAIVVGIVALPAFGYRWWATAAVVLGLAALVRGVRARPVPGYLPATGRQVFFRRVLRAARVLFIVVLAAWLGLLTWWELARGGSAPPAKAPNLIRVVSWNIHCGQDEGMPWEQLDWTVRKAALRAALDQAKPDILCVQEAMPDQMFFLKTVLRQHRRVGNGRDGGSVGEHCAIYFEPNRFEQLDDGTFWLEEPTDEPRPGSAFRVKRICTWVRLRDRESGGVFRVYNTHLYLTEEARLEAARLICKHITERDPTDGVILAADFNARPGAPSRQLFAEAGLVDGATRAGKPAGAPTVQMYGIGLWSLDAILVSRRWQVRDYRVLDVKPDNTFPSDHYGVLADLALQE